MPIENTFVITSYNQQCKQIATKFRCKNMNISKYESILALLLCQWNIKIDKFDPNCGENCQFVDRFTRVLHYSAVSAQLRIISAVYMPDVIHNFVPRSDVAILYIPCLK